LGRLEQIVLIAEQSANKMVCFSFRICLSEEEFARWMAFWKEIFADGENHLQNALEFPVQQASNRSPQKRGQDLQSTTTRGE
jgi:hypothetical protein